LIPILITTASLLAGIVVATLVTFSFDADRRWLAWLIGQVIIACLLATGLYFASKRGGRGRSLSRLAFVAWFLVTLVLAATVVGLLFSPGLRGGVGNALDAVIRVFGIYPGGADLWLPIGMTFWIVSSLAPIVPAVVLANLLRERAGRT
jgi:hypothetical protein